jgi:hypothetical protein
MAETYTAVSTGPFVGAYTMPQGADTRNIASVRTPMEAMADDVAFVHTSLVGVTSYTRLCPSNVLAMGHNGCIPGIDNTDIEPNTSEDFAITVPNGATITGIRALINPADDALPTTNFTLAIRKREVTTGTQSIIGSTVDPLTGGSYQAAHDVTVTGLSEVVDYSAFTYWIRCIGEAGGDEDSVSLLELAITYSAAFDKGG